MEQTQETHSSVTASTIPPSREESPTQQAPAIDGSAVPSSEEHAHGDPPIAEEKKSASLTVRFNHRDVTLDSATAASYCQQWMHYTAPDGLRERISRLAAAEGCSVDRLVDAILSRQEQQRREACLQEAGGNQVLADKLFALTAPAATQPPDPEQQLTERLQREFDSLCRMFPERGFGNVNDVPAAAVRLAAEQNIPLVDGYLRYRRQEEQRAEQNRLQQQSAAVKSTGQQSAGHLPDAVDDVTAAMLAGVRG